MKHKKLLSLILALVLTLTVCVPALAADSTLRLIVPENWELEVGDSRTLDYTFSAEVTDRMLTWSVEPVDGSIAKVDDWGRVTGVAPGTATITATQITDGGTALTDSVTVHVVASSMQNDIPASIVDYAGAAVAEVENLQKLVTRWSSDEALADDAVPASVKAVLNGETAVDGAVYTAGERIAQGSVTWEITAYGVLRTDSSPITNRDTQMRFMGDRYFYEKDTTSGKVLAIVSDGANGIWTVMASGITHIEMVEMSAAEKASVMSNATQQYVSRRGMVAEANLVNGEWVPRETDNDGLWTAMYGAGELFRYAVLREALASNPRNRELRAMTQEAEESATLATEAVLLLANISMRQGEVDAYVRYIGDSGYTLYNGIPVFDNSGKGISDEALIAGGNYSLTTPDFSPAQNLNIGSVTPVAPAAWADPMTETGNNYARQTRLLGGFIARTYSLHGEAGGNADTYSGQIYYDLADYSEDNRVAEGKSRNEGIVNNEDLKGVLVDASGKIPDRLWSDLLGADVEITDIVYKGDTSTDEIIGHMFLYKIAYDVFRDSDPELAGIIADTMDRFAQHLSDNEYMLVDATGQPTTWGKMNRDYFYTYRWGAPSSPLTASVLLTAFKVAAYVTGFEKWEKEYQLLLTDGAYLYGDIMATHTARDKEFLDKYAAPLLGDTLQGATLTQYLGASGLSAELSFLLRTFAQYSDEEMAMLAFYTLFQLETDETILGIYRTALDEWWDESMQYSENPLWYYIYQLAYPDDTDITDAYGNNILETAAWSLSRHPIDTRRWCASNTERDDIMIFNMEDYSSALDTRGGLSIRKTELPPTAIGAEGIIGVLLYGGITNGTVNIGYGDWPMDIEYAVAAPDERAMHKYNASSYLLDTDYNPYQMEGSTTYTLPYWMGVYHGMLELSEFAYVPAIQPEPEPEPKPAPASELFDDVTADDWFHDAVTYTAAENLFAGVAARTFAPQGSMTRAMMTTVLWRLDGSPDASGSAVFSDVAPDTWYSNAVSWAAEAKVVEGVGGGLFKPDDLITREQMAAMLWRYAKYAGYDVSIGEDTNILSYNDAPDISAYAIAALQWACGAGLMDGRGGGYLAPKDTVKRCEVAMVLLRFGKLEN